MFSIGTLGEGFPGQFAALEEVGFPAGTRWASCANKVIGNAKRVSWILP